MTVIIVCLASYVVMVAIFLGLMATPRMRSHIRELYEGRLTWHAYLFLLLMALAWPIIVGATIAEPFIRRRRR